MNSMLKILQNNSFYLFITPFLYYNTKLFQAFGSVLSGTLLCVHRGNTEDGKGSHYLFRSKMFFRGMRGLRPTRDEFSAKSRSFLPSNWVTLLWRLQREFTSREFSSLKSRFSRRLWSASLHKLVICWSFPQTISRMARHSSWHLINSMLLSLNCLKSASISFSAAFSSLRCLQQSGYKHRPTILTKVYLEQLSIGEVEGLNAMQK